MKLSKYDPTSSNMPSDSELNDQNGASLPRWKNRLQSFKNSLRASLRSKKRKPTNDLIQDVEDGAKENCKSNGKSRKSSLSHPSVSTRDEKENKVLFWREKGVEQKHTRLSKKNKKQSSDKPKSTSKWHSVHKKTLSDSQDLNKRNHEWRKYYSHNNISELQTQLSQEGKNHNVSCDVIKELSSAENSPNFRRRRSKKNTKTSLSRPKSLNILTSLFKRSSTSKNELKTKRGNLIKTENHCSTKAKSSTSVPAECAAFERRCDPELSSTSTESLDDNDLYTDERNRNIKRYDSLKRSRASLIFPRNNSYQNCGNLREKARTFCGDQDFLALESSTNISESSDFDSQLILEKRRESCPPKEPKKRSVSLVVPLSPSTVDFVHCQLTEESLSLNDFRSFIKTDRSHLRYQRASINNIRCISKRMSMSAQSFANIPSVGVTYVNNDGVENTLVILSGNASQSCYDLFKENERIYVPLKFNCSQETAEEHVAMGNQTGGTLQRSSSFGDFLERGGTLTSANSTPDLYRATFANYSLARPEEHKTNMNRMIKGLSLKRHSLTINPKSHDPSEKVKKHRKLFGLGTLHHRDKKGKNESSMNVAKCKSLSRSVDCLSEKPLPTIRRDYRGLFRPSSSSKTANKMESGGKNQSINSESDENTSQTSTDSGHDSTITRPLPVTRGSRLKALDSENFSTPSSIENGGVFLRNYRRCSMGVDGSTYPENSPPIPRMSTLERERSKSEATYPNDPQIPPAVRPRIQSLEELSPVEAEVILRKKKSFASRKTRVKHSLSMPTEELSSVDLSDVKRYSFGEDMSNFSDAAPVPLTAYKSFSAELLMSSQESLDTINSSHCPSEMGSTTSIASDKLLSPPTHYITPCRVSLEDISKSPTILEEPSSFNLLEPEGESKKTSLSRNPRLGRSTGDLSFELSSTLRRQREGESMFEDMDVPEAFAEALWDHVTMDPEELSFKAGDIITVISMTNIDWWFGQVGEMVGWFPAPFVRVRVSQELDEIEHQQAPPVRTRKFTNEGLLTKEVVRARVVNELLETEKAYVKNINDVVEGYLKQAQKRDDMFSEEEIYTLFSNIEDIHAFHKKLLAQMKNCYVKDDPCASQIGAVFLANKQGFNIYSEYCNNHPQAIAEFKTLIESNKYKHFFEACRLLQGMINIPLDGFLLTPVQKICKYPLQLAELLKHTHPSHKDYEPVSQALQSMKGVAGLINERKRKVESISKIAKWQGTIEGWEGDNVLERSSELFCSGEVYKVSNGTTQERVCFLFDHQLIYCKKDILRKNALSYKGRIDMDLARVEWLEDGQETHKGEPLNNAWKIYNSTDDKWYVVYTKKPEQKTKWKEAFEKERAKTKEKVESGLEISQTTRRALMRSASSSFKGKKAAEKREKYLRSVSQTDALKSPPSPTLRLPPPVSSEDFIKEEDGDSKDSIIGFLQRTSALRRSFGLRGSKRSHKDKRTSSVF